MYLECSNLGYHSEIKVLFTKHSYSMYENKIVRDYRDGKVSKEDLDKCSTYDIYTVVNNGLSAAITRLVKRLSMKILLNS